MKVEFCFEETGTIRRTKKQKDRKNVEPAGLSAAGGAHFKTE